MMNQDKKLMAPAEPGAGALGFIVVGGVFILALMAWTWFGTINIVSATTGDVVPGSKVRQVQHLEGGIVRQIHAQERQFIEEGQILVSLDSTQIDAEVAELEARLTGLEIEIIRLESELRGSSEASWPEDLIARVPDQIEAAQALMETRRLRLSAEFRVQRELIAQREQEIAEVTARMSTARTSRRFLAEQIDISDDLLQQNITNRMTHINLLKDMAILDGQLQEDRALLQRAQAGLAEAEARLTEIAQRFSEEARDRVSIAKREFDELNERLRKFQDSQNRMDIRSPVSGIVKTIAVSTIGGVIRPGDILAEIVPIDDRLVIDARLPLNDIGFVRPGQAVQITLTSADASRFGALDGRVVGISPDALLDEEGVPYYAVRVEPETDRFQDGETEYRLYPGMKVSSSIIIGERRIAQYILDPYVKSMRSALQER